MQKRIDIQMQTFSNIITESAYDVLEEAAGAITSDLTNQYLQKHGRITIGESEFLGRMVVTVLSEAIGDFIPEEVDVPDATAIASSDEGALQLWDAAGNPFVFQDGQLVAVEGDDNALDGVQDGQEPQGEGAPTEISNGTPEEEKIVDESATPITENTDTTNDKILEENTLIEESQKSVDMIVANLMK